jgi:hypothetical protein
MNFLKTPQHTSLFRGRAWIEELRLGHPDRMKNNLGISQEGFVFVSLEQLLIEKGGGLQSSHFMDSTERLIRIFLYAVVTDLSMREACRAIPTEHRHHDPSGISQCHELLSIEGGAQIVHQVRHRVDSCASEG